MRKSLALILTSAGLLAGAVALTPGKSQDRITPVRPNSQLTPGAADPSLTADIICSPQWRTGLYRNVSQRTRIAVYQSYGMPRPRTGYCDTKQGCEVDHLIPIELGGSNSQLNLWPEPYEGQWNAHIKDRLENYLHKQVCSGKMSLAEAQNAIAKDWIAAYSRAFQ